MYSLYDPNHNKVAPLPYCKDIKIERELSGLETLSFSYPQSDDKYKYIQNEGFIRTDKNEYVIKEFNPKTDWTEIVAQVNTDDLYGKEFDDFDIDDTLLNVANLSLSDTGWTVGYCDVTKPRHIKLKYVNALKILKEVINIWNCDIWYDAINKQVNFYTSMGSDKGVYFIDKLNLKELELQGTTYDFITRLIPLGYKNMDISSVNSGCNYVENHQYSNKVITGYWRTKQYTDPQALKDDAEFRLEKYSRPVKAYSAKVIDLAKSDSNYSILSYELGDIITLEDTIKGIKDTVRIVKTTEYPLEPEKNEVEIANRLQILQDMQISFMDAADSVDAVTNGDGSTVDGSAVDSIDSSQLTNVQNLHILTAQIDDLSANYASISSLNAATARIGTLETTSATITQLNATNANITDLQTNKANVTDLNATNSRIDNLIVGTAQIADASITTAKIANLAVGVANIQVACITGALIANATITNTNIASGTIQNANIADATITGAKIAYGTITNANIANATIGTAQIALGAITTALIGTAAVQTTQIADGSITDAKIVSLTASKLTVGTIDASTINVINLNCANLTVGTINGKQISQGTITGGTSGNLASGTITNQNIAANTITAAQIASNTITAANMLIGDYTNFAAWPNKGSASSCPWDNNFVVDTSTYHTAVASLRIPPSSTSNYLDNAIPVLAGQTIYFDFWVKLDSSWSGGSANSKLRVTDQNGSLIYNISYNTAATNWTHYTGTYTVGSTVTAIKVQLLNDATSGNIWVDDIIISKQNAGYLIVDGCITGTKIAAQTITANNIAANTITAAQIAASTITSVQIAAGTITTDRLAVQSYGLNKILNADGSLNSANPTKGLNFTNWTEYYITTTGYITRDLKPFVDGGNVPVFHFCATDTTSHTMELISNPIVVDPNKQYLLEGWFYRASGSGLIYLGIEQTDTGTADLDGNGPYMVQAVSPTNGQWVYYSGYIYPARTKGKLTVAYNPSTDTTVTVDNIGGFPSSGGVNIGNTYFNYTGISGNQFTGVTNGNVSATMAVGTIVGLRVPPGQSTATTANDLEFQSQYVNKVQVKVYASYGISICDTYVYGLSLREVGGTLIDGSGIVTNSITGDKIAANTITATNIAANTITAAQMAAGTITAASGIISSLSCSVLTGGTLTLGGASNGNGILNIKDASGNIIVSGNNGGLTVNNGAFVLNNNGFTLISVNTSYNSVEVGACLSSQSTTETEGSTVYDVGIDIGNGGASAMAAGITGYASPHSSGTTVNKTGLYSQWEILTRSYGAALYGKWNFDASASLNVNCVAVFTSNAQVNGSLTVGSGGMNTAGQQILNGSDTWFRSYNQCGWYNSSYGGGIYMTDTTWVRTYNGKGFSAGGGYQNVGKVAGYAWSGSIGPNSSVTLTHNLGYVPIVEIEGTNGNLIITHSSTTTQTTIYNYNTASNTWTGAVYIF